MLYRIVRRTFGWKMDILSLTNRQIYRRKVTSTWLWNPTGVHVLKNSQMQSCLDHITFLIRVVENCLAVILLPEFLSLLHVLHGRLQWDYGNGITVIWHRHSITRGKSTCVQRVLARWLTKRTSVAYQRASTCWTHVLLLRVIQFLCHITVFALPYFDCKQHC